MYLKLLTTLVLSLSFSHAKTFVISDIDDTIKVSHIRKVTSSAANAFKTRVPFAGSADLFQFLKSEIKDTSFYYVTNAPRWLMTRSHLKFLERNNFPGGGLYLKSEYSSEEHKVKTILNIIQKGKPDRVILIGDNGENDIVFYDKVNQVLKKSRPEIEVHQFIHIVYDGKEILEPRQDQNSYVTSLGILSVLKETPSLKINSKRLAAFTNKQADLVLKSKKENDSLMFPEWLKCGGYTFNNTFSPRGKIQRAFEYIEENCL